MKLKNKILPLLLLASTAVGCTDGFETINSDPNKLYEVNLQSIFPGTVYKTMNAISELNNNRMWSYSRYITNVAFQTPWNERGDGFYRKFYVEILRDLEELAKAYGCCKDMESIHLLPVAVTLWSGRTEPCRYGRRNGQAYL